MKELMDRYAVFGNPITQSKSPLIHGLFAKQTSQLMSYEAIEVPIDDLKNRLDNFFSSNGRGCNITVPFKEQAYDFADSLTERAKQAGAVNTLKLEANGTITGDNTDGEGLVADLLNNNIKLKNSRILLIGAGGAARGICGSLLLESPTELIIANRTNKKAHILAGKFLKYGNIHAVEFSDLTGPFDLIINATSASLYGRIPPISEKLINTETAIYDIMYGNSDTEFNAWAKINGAKLVLDGSGMLVEQAAISFKIWRGIAPETNIVLNKLKDSCV